MCERTVKLARSALNAWKARHLREVQNGLCPLCGQVIDLTIPKEGVVDHDHDTGRIRGVLHRSCNAAEGKASNAIAQWGVKSNSYTDIIWYMENLLAYLKAEPTKLIYPLHKTPDERKDARNKVLRERRAAAKAAVRLRAVKKE